MSWIRHDLTQIVNIKCKHYKANSFQKFSICYCVKSVLVVLVAMGIFINFLEKQT